MTVIPQITADEVYKAIQDKSDVVIVDVRTAQECLRGKIEGCINIPVEIIEKKVQEIIPDKEKTIYVYCLSGSRSDIAVSIIINLGYANAFSMTNGLLMWRLKKYPLA